MGLFELARRPLVEHFEGPNGGDLVAPELYPDGFSGRDREEVQDAAAHRELPDFLDERDPLESPFLQLGHQLGEVGLRARPEGASHVRQVRGNRDALLEPPWRGHQDLGATREQRFHRLDPQSADLEVRLVLFVGQRLLLREQMGRSVGTEEDLEVGFGRHRRLRVGSDEYEDALRSRAVQRGHHRRTERAADTAERDRRGRTREGVCDRLDGRACAHGGQHGVRKRHRM